MGFTGFQLNSQTVTIGALTLGLGVDYAVHIATRLEERPCMMFSRAISLDLGVDCHYRSCDVCCSTNNRGGFSVVNLSSLVPLQLFGQAFVVAITLALMSAFFSCPLGARLLESEIRHG